MKFLVTGGAGFIGFHVAKKLICTGHCVVVLQIFDFIGAVLAPFDLLTSAIAVIVDQLNEVRIFLLQVIASVFEPFGLEIQLPSPADENIISTQSIKAVVLIVLMSIYYIMCDSSRLQGTPGKALVGAKVINSNGQRIGLLHSCLRHFCRVVFIILSPLILIVRIVITGGNLKRLPSAHSWHDYCSRTEVIYPRRESRL